jgi:hypothetical protein
MQKKKYCSRIIKNIYCNNISTLLMQYIFFYIKKAITTCVVLGDEYIDGDFGCGVLQVVKGVITHCKFS